MVRGYEHVGQKRGGLGRRAKNPWIRRTFALGYDGVLSYFDIDSLDKERGQLNLVRAEAELSVTIEDDEAPTEHILVITHIQGQRWKLCADTFEELNEWRNKMAKFCRSTAATTTIIKTDQLKEGDALTLEQGHNIISPSIATRTILDENTDNGENKALVLQTNKRVVPAASHRKYVPYQRERRGSKSVKEYALNSTRTYSSWVPIAVSCTILNLCFILALSTNSKFSWFTLILFTNVHIALVISRCLAQAPPVSETLIAMIIPPARLPGFLIEEEEVVISSLKGNTPEESTTTKTQLEKKLSSTISNKKQQGLRQVPFDPDGGPPGTWSKAPASSFRVRQLGYAKNKSKAASAHAFFRVVAVHLFDVEKRINKMCQNNGEYFLIDPATVASPHPDVPALFVINAQVPAETGPFRVKLDADGAGYHVVIVCELDPTTAEELRAIQTNPKQFEKEDPRRYKALNLLITYCKNAPSEPQLGAKYRGRFKVIAQLRNIDECSIPNVAKSYNGKPALINKTGILSSFGGPPLSSTHGLEMDINIHAFGYLARSGLQTIYRDFQDFILSIAFCLEARSDDELPENILASFDLNHCNWTMASPL